MQTMSWWIRLNLQIRALETLSGGGERTSGDDKPSSRRRWVLWIGLAWILYGDFGFLEKIGRAHV